MAMLMFDGPKLGLEAPLSELQARLPSQPIEATVHTLAYARLVRLGGTDRRQVSFVHRRFHEYFVARGWMRDTPEIRLGDIPTDSQERDALALFCEVADEAQARTIASYCWVEMKGLADGTLSTGDPAYLRAVHSLRFLRDAFRNRPEALAAFRDELEALLEGELTLRNGLLPAKIALEAAGLVGPQRLEGMLLSALETHDPWLAYTALRACRYLSRLSPPLERRWLLHFMNLPSTTLRRDGKDLQFSLALSDAFAPLAQYLRWRTLDQRLLLPSQLMVLLLSPIICVLLLSLAALSVGAGRLFSLFVNSGWSGSYPQVSMSDGLVAILRFLTLVSVGAVCWDICTTDPGSWNSDAVAESFGIFFPATLMLLPDPSPIVVWALSVSFTFVIALGAVSTSMLFLLWRFMKHAAQFRTAFSERERRSIIARSSVLAVFVLLIWVASSLDIRSGGNDTPSLGTLNAIIVLLASLVASFVGVVLIGRAAIRLYRHYRDSRLAKQILQRGYSRALIQEGFDALKTKAGRSEFVEQLALRPAAPDDQWPHGLPYLPEDPASTMLAQLEERWLGLADR